MDKVKQDSRADYTDVFQQQTRTVWVRVDGVEVEMPLERVKAGDLVRSPPARPSPSTATSWRARPPSTSTS